MIRSDGIGENHDSNLIALLAAIDCLCHFEVFYQQSMARFRVRCVPALLCHP